MHPSPVEFDRGVFLRSSRWPGSFGGSVGSGYLPFDESLSHRWVVTAANNMRSWQFIVSLTSNTFAEKMNWQRPINASVAGRIWQRSIPPFKSLAGEFRWQRLLGHSMNRRHIGGLCLRCGYHGRWNRWKERGAMAKPASGVVSLDPRHIVEGIDGGVRVRFMMAVVDGWWLWTREEWSGRVRWWLMVMGDGRGPDGWWVRGCRVITFQGGNQ